MNTFKVTMAVFAAAFIGATSYANSAEAAGRATKHTGGKNPAISHSYTYKEVRKGFQKHTPLGRGRHVLTTVKPDGANALKVTSRFENHHRSRGWTLCNRITVHDAKGKTLATYTFQKGLRPKGWRGYKRWTGSTRISYPKNAKSVATTSWRCSTKRVGKQIEGELKKVAIEIVKAIGKKKKDKPTS